MARDYKINKQQLLSSNISRIAIAVDSVENGEIVGRLCNQHECILRSFSGAFQMIKIADELFDKYNYPQASHELRSFGNAKPTSRNRQKFIRPRIVKHANISGGADMDEKNALIESGEKATFMVQVQFRQNATWQGTIKWTEGKKTIHFRSALELIKLIDEAVALSSPADSTACVNWCEAEQLKDVR